MPSATETPAAEHGTGPERTLWEGQPRPDLAGRAARVLVPIGATFIFTGLMFSAMVGTIIATWMYLLGLPFVALGIYLTLSTRRARRQAGHTFYRLTTHSAIVRRPKPFQSIIIEERFTPLEVARVEAIGQGDDTGDIVFFLRDEAVGDGVTIARRAFEGVDGLLAIAVLARDVLVTTGPVAALEAPSLAFLVDGTPLGPRSVTFHDSSGEVHSGPLVTDSAASAGVATTPNGLAAVAVHEGPADRLSWTHEVIRAWCKHRGLQTTGLSWEVQDEAPDGRGRIEVYHQIAVEP